MRSRQEAGQALAEFALIAPIFFLLLFGVIQIGLLMGAQNGLVNAVRDAARRAATYRVNDASLDAFAFPGVCSTLRTELEDRLSRQIPGFNSLNLDPEPVIAYEWKPNNDTPTTYFLVAHVSVTYRHTLFVPLVSFFIDGADGVQDGRLQLNASEQMRVENPDLATAGADQACAGGP